MILKLDDMFINWEEDRQGPIPEGAVIVDRFPEEFGEDLQDGKWVTNPRAKANHYYGETHIQEARMQKRIEALLIKAGVPLGEGSLLAAEATLQNTDVESLATTVLDKASEFINSEVNRQTAQLEKAKVTALKLHKEK
jgi:predicted solute-binding protein